MSAWAARYEELALTGVRSREVTERIALHRRRFGEYLSVTYGHEHLAKASCAATSLAGATRSSPRGSGR